MSNDLQRLQAVLPRRYTLLDAIDEGGLSRVYRAREELPDRDVVIKVFDEHLSARLGGDSFVREIQRATRLVHPHIVPIYSAGDADGSLYYVMPFIDGESLRDRLDREGPLPLDVALRITGQVADALHYAHEKGIVHRDVKPTNVLLQGGHALLSDFGVAHALRAAAGAKRRAVFGTPEYMSPEQLRGERTIDERTDTYALSCILYEMLHGRPPYEGPSFDPDERPGGPEAPPAIDPSVPPRVARLIRSGLSTDPDLRPADVLEFAAGLADGTGAPDEPPPADKPPVSLQMPSFASPGRVAAALVIVAAIGLATVVWRGSGTSSLVASGQWEASVAVMPFENRTDDTTFDNLGQSLADEIITNLTAVPEVRVIDTYTAASLLKDSLGTPRLLDTLNVEHVIHGFLERYGDELVVSISESDRGGFLSRRDQYRITPENLNADQVSIAENVALSFLARVGLRGDLASGPAELGPGRDAYLAGNGLLGQRTPAAMAEAISYFRESIRLDPEYAPAQAAISSAYALAVYYKYDVGVPAYELAARSLAAADSAVALDPNLANGYSARGYIRALLGIEIDAAEADFDRAEELAPNAPNGPSWSARILAERGLIDEAFSEARRARDLDPLQAGRRTALASLGFQLGDYEVVIEEARQAYRLEEELLLAKAFEGRALALTGRGVECLRIDFGVYDLVRALCLHSLGRVDEARAMAEEAGAELRTSGIDDPDYLDELVAQDLASYYGLVGDAAGATRWLRYAFDLSPAGVDARILYSALFDRVRDDPGFSAAVDEVKAEARSRVARERERIARERAG